MQIHPHTSKQLLDNGFAVEVAVALPFCITALQIAQTATVQNNVKIEKIGADCPSEVVWGVAIFWQLLYQCTASWPILVVAIMGRARAHCILCTLASRIELGAAVVQYILSIQFIIQ